MTTRTLISMMTVAIVPMAAAQPAGAQTYSSVAYAQAYAPPAWQDQDPANAIYKSAREELNRNNYTKAAALFSQIITRFPRSAYAPDAYYWQAFAMYKI